MYSSPYFRGVQNAAYRSNIPSGFLPYALQLLSLLMQLAPETQTGKAVLQADLSGRFLGPVVSAITPLMHFTLKIE